MLLVSVFSNSGEFTNWRIIDGTSGSIVTFHLEVENAVSVTGRASHNKAEGRTLE